MELHVCLVEALGLLNLYLPTLFLFPLPLLFLCFPSGYLLLTTTLLYNIWPKNIRLNHKSLYVWATRKGGYTATYTLICTSYKIYINTAQHILHLLSSSVPSFSALLPFSSSPPLPAASCGPPLSCGLPPPPDGYIMRRERLEAIAKASGW